MRPDVPLCRVAFQDAAAMGAIGKGAAVIRVVVAVLDQWIAFFQFSVGPYR